MSFLSNYREFTKGTESHPTYHTFCALVALSSIVSRRVWIDLGYFKVFPNLYVILVGPPGNKKTSAMDIAYKLLFELKASPLSAECVTKEKLILDIGDQETVNSLLPPGHPQQVFTPMTCMVTELSEFLGAGGPAMINFLTTIYDREIYEHRTKNKGTTLITGPYLNLLACTTPDWITSYLRMDVISGGFSRRALFVYETSDSGRIAFPEVTDAARKGWADVCDYAKKVQKVSGAFTWHPEAKKFFEDWYVNLKVPADEMLVGYYKSKHIQLLKLSMLISLSESPTCVLTKENLMFGLDLLNLMEVNLDRVFSGMGRNELNAVSNKVLEYVINSPKQKINIDGKEFETPCVEEKYLQGVTYRLANQQEFAGIIQHLISTEKVGRLTAQPTAARPFARTYLFLRQK